MESRLNPKKINLIPTGMAVPAQAVSLARTLEKVSVVAAFILVFLIVIVGAIYLFFSLEDKKVAQNVEKLKISVTNLSQSEQKLILAKDRLSKIEATRNSPSANIEVTNYEKFSKLVNGMQESKVSEANITQKGTEITLISSSVASFTELIKPLYDFSTYKNIIVTSLGYNPSSGFMANIMLRNN